MCQVLFRAGGDSEKVSNFPEVKQVLGTEGTGTGVSDSRAGAKHICIAGQWCYTGSNKELRPEGF